MSWKRREVIGDCVLYLGDCLEVMGTLPTVDHIVCDPPYEELVHSANKKLAAGRILDNKRNPFNDFGFDSIDSIRENFVNLIKARGWFVAFCTAEGVAKWADVINESDIKYKRPCIWIKPDGTPQFNGQMPGMGYECFVTAWCGPGASKWNNGSKHGIYTFSKDSPNKASKHPTEKPIKLMRAIIKDFTNEGEYILDPFMGSGTTGAACAQMGRKFVGIELDEKYFDVACKRIEEAYKQPDLFVEPPKEIKQEELL